MATFTFDGSQSFTTAFNATVDRVVFDLDAADLASVVQDEDNNTVTFVAVSGAVLTLTGTNFAAFTADNVVAGFDSDITFGFGTDAGETDAGNVLIGLEGADILNANTGEVDGALVFGNEGDDTVNATGADVRLYGGQGDDDLILTNADDDSSSLIVGGLGAEDVTVTGGVAAGYEGSVTIFGGNEAGDPTDAADDIDVALADDATALIFGNGGADDIDITGSGSATVYGGQGNDSVAAAVNSGLFVGGLGADQLDIDLVGGDATVTIYGGNEAGDPTDGNDDIDVTSTVDGGSAVVFSNGGNDDIDLTGAFDTEFAVYSGQGNDSINGTVGGDSEVYGGLGFDTIDLTVDGDGSAVSIFGGNGLADAGDGADTINVELAGDVVVGAATVRQTAEIFGNGGDDVITLTGEGAASVNGGAGNDEIVVGADGRYTLTGGQGNDEFDLSGFDFTPATPAVPADDNGTPADPSDDTPAVPAVAGDAEADVPFITDMAFGTDTIDLTNVPTFTSDQTGATFAQSTLGAAAEAAFDAGAAGRVAGEVAVLFNYQGDSYVAFGTNAAEAAGATSGAEVDGYFKVTGYTGTFGVSSFE